MNRYYKWDRVPETFDSSGVYGSYSAQVFPWLSGSRRFVWIDVDSDSVTVWTTDGGGCFIHEYTCTSLLSAKRWVSSHLARPDLYQKYFSTP